MKPAAILLTTLLLTQILTRPATATPIPPANQIAQADLDDGTLTPQQVQQTAKNITVRITTEKNGGSGVIIAQKGGNYLILTNAHVVRRATKIQIQAPDGQKYQATPIDGGFDAKYDLALLQFTSKAKYTLANLSSVSGSPLEPGRTIYSAGFPFDSKNIRIASGQISQLSDLPFNDGTQIGYVTNKGEKGIRQGMSGGAIFDAQGNLLGINTVGVAPILPDYTYNDGSKPLAKLKAQYRQANWGIPTYNFLTNVKADILYGYDNLPKAEHQVTPSGYLARLNTKARQMTVRIETSSGNGSGVIVAKEGNSYYVLTAKHVVQNLDTKQRLTNLQLVTYDQEHYGATSTVVAGGADLAVIKFSSNTNYPIAQLGQYSPNNNDFVFVGGFPDRAVINSPLWQWQFNPGYVSEKEQGKFNAQDDRSFSNGYDLIYGSVSYGGMSGGPVFDTEGRLIGIHGRAESTDKVILGQSLGISIQTFLELVGKLQISPQLLRTTKNIPATLSPTDRKMVITSMQNITQPRETDSGENWLAYGNQLYRTFQTTKSVAAFEKAISKGKVLGFYGKALSLWRLRKLELSETAIAQAIATVPPTQYTNYYYFWKYQSFILSGSRKYDKALIAINTAIKLESHDLTSLTQKALVLKKQQQYAVAISVYDEIIGKRPEAYAYINRGIAKLDLGDKEGAISDWDQAIKLNPSFDKAYNNRGVVKSDLGNKKGALIDLNKAIEINPNYAGAYYNRAYVKSDLGDNQNAIIDLSQAIEINYNYRNTYYRPNAFKSKLRDKEREYSSYSNAIKINSGNAEAYYKLGVLKLELGDRGGSISDLDRAIKINANYADAYNIRGNAQLALNDKYGAIFNYDIVIKLKPKYAGGYYNRGIVKLDLGDNQGAITDCNIAIRLNPKYVAAYVRRGLVRVKLGDKQGAIADYNTAIKLNPNQANAYNNRGLAKSALGDKQGAIDDLTKAANLYRQQEQMDLYQSAMKLIDKLRGG